MIDRTPPISNRIPTANPIFPPVLIPPEVDSAVELDDVAVEEAAEAMELVDATPVAAMSATDESTEVFGDVIAEGRVEV